MKCLFSSFEAPLFVKNNNEKKTALMMNVVFGGRLCLSCYKSLSIKPKSLQNFR